MELNKLIIRPEYFSSGIADEHMRYLGEGQKVIPTDLFAEIISFNNEYLEYASMNIALKTVFWQEIYFLDQKGYSLKERLEKSLRIPVVYYSEGLLKELPSKPEIDLYRHETTRLMSLKKNWYLLLRSLLGKSNYGVYNNEVLDTQ